MGSDQIHALIFDYESGVILERARGFGPRFERLASLFRAFKLSFCGIPARSGVFIGAADDGEKRQDQSRRENDAQDWPDYSGGLPQRLPHSFVNTTRPSASTAR